MRSGCDATTPCATRLFRFRGVAAPACAARWRLVFVAIPLRSTPLPGRLELPTLRLTASRSNQLSYGSACWLGKGFAVRGLSSGGASFEYSVLLLTRWALLTFGAFREVACLQLPAPLTFHCSSRVGGSDGFRTSSCHFIGCPLRGRAARPTLRCGGGVLCSLGRHVRRAQSLLPSAGGARFKRPRRTVTAERRCVR